MAQYICKLVSTPSKAFSLILLIVTLLCFWRFTSFY